MSDSPATVPPPPPDQGEQAGMEIHDQAPALLAMAKRMRMRATRQPGLSLEQRMQARGMASRLETAVAASLRSLGDNLPSSRSPAPRPPFQDQPSGPRPPTPTPRGPAQSRPSQRRPSQKASEPT